MNQTNLIFESPDYLNNLTTQAESNPKQWTTPTGEPLEINADNWTISSGSQSASITEWFVNERDYQMTLDANQDGFIPLNQTFAISMIGQLFPKDLIKYLSSIDKVYNQIDDLKDIPPNQPEDEPEDKQDDEDFW